ncbi:MAG: hypothetical protein FD145_1105 [Candidatus Saganbacteria bacterium]|uniref:Uncharacterized protein n=1 Tax=Candidatus Saganbacteria bacterium TaxID=2575572 RepID=A0A833L0I5_UNCSA|nr:MAG: hypothetical protein FD145_1105 [Candidatus Saganbacteria bacterium]
MSKRYREFLIDVLTKTYQLVFGIAVITPIVSRKLDLSRFFLSCIAALFVLIWAAAISARMED